MSYCIIDMKYNIVLAANLTEEAAVSLVEELDYLTQEGEYEYKEEEDTNSDTDA